MTAAQPKRIDMIIHDLNHSGVSNAAVTLVNAMAENNIPTKLIIIGEKKASPFPINPAVETKFLGIVKGEGALEKILYVIRAYFILTTYLARTKCKNLFVWGKEFTVIAEFIRLSVMLDFKLVGVNVISIAAHLKNRGNIVTRDIANYTYKSILKHPNHIIAQSDGMVDELSNIYNVPKDKITVVFPPIQAKFFNAVEKTTKTNKILFVGRLAEQKNPLAALEIFSKLQNKNATLEFVGEGELEAELKAKVKELGIEGRVLFAGRQDDVVPFLKNANVLILTSNYEGFGMVLAEAIACGVPVISFNCPTGPSEIVIDGINGYLIPQGNVDLFAKRLDKALEQEWNSKRIAETASKFHPDTVIKGYLEVIKQNLA